MRRLAIMVTLGLAGCTSPGGLPHLSVASCANALRAAQAAGQANAVLQTFGFDGPKAEAVDQGLALGTMAVDTICAGVAVDPAKHTTPLAPPVSP